MIDEDELLQTISKLNADNEEPRRESRAYNYGSGGGLTYADVTWILTVIIMLLLTAIGGTIYYLGLRSARIQDNLVKRTIDSIQGSGTYDTIKMAEIAPSTSGLQRPSPQPCRGLDGEPCSSRPHMACCVKGLLIGSDPEANP